MKGAKSSPRTTVTKRERSSIEKNSPANFFASSFDTFNLREKAGVKAELKAPSANILLSRFGILKATKKASVKLVAPKSVAIMTSLTSPKTLLPKMESDTIRDDLSTDFAIVGEL